MVFIIGKSYKKSDVSAIFDEEDPKANLLFIKAVNDYSQGNFTVKLADNPVPIVFSYATNQRNTDCLLTVRMNNLSKASKIESKGYMEKSLDASLNTVLHGVAPKGSRPMRTSNKEISAWLTADNDVVIRSPYTIIAPMPKSRIGSPDGHWVFRVVDILPSMNAGDSYCG
ncbi:DotH/IcmK family type IV secretion protein [Neisseria sp. CCUG17229]|uniref:DotH/IcmK family type IV secretion protein n=1 Tax=Neisseria sp. CCUG17229 TaxID=3392036 RepID=UPI003A0FE63F